MSGPESTAAVSGGKQSVSEVQMQLIQLVREQNRLLQQLVENEPANAMESEPSNASSASLPEPKYSQKQWELKDVLSHWDTDIKLEARGAFNIMRRYLIHFDDGSYVTPGDHKMRVIDQLGNLNANLSSISGSPSRGGLFSRCNSIEYRHQRTEDEEQPSMGSVWFVSSIIRQNVFNLANA